MTRFKVGDEVFGASGLKEAGAIAEALVAEEKGVFPSHAPSRSSKPPPCLLSPRQPGPY